MPQYAKILEMDRKIRDYPVPYSMRSKCGQPEPVEPSKGLYMQRYMCMAAKEMSASQLPHCMRSSLLTERPTSDFASAQGVLRPGAE